MNTFRIAQSIVLFLAAAIAVGCVNAAGAGSNEPKQRIVRYGDLDLAKPDGVKVLYRRISIAAKVVCEPDISVPITLKSRQMVCRQEAIADAVSKINHPNLTAYHAARMGTTNGRDTKVASSR